jgi:hypothetical protein
MRPFLRLRGKDRMGALNLESDTRPLAPTLTLPRMRGRESRLQPPVAHNPVIGLSSLHAQ